MFSLILKNKYWPVLKFLLIFSLFSVPLYLVLYSPLSLMPLQTTIANQIAKLLTLSGIPSFNQSNLLIFKTRTGVLLKIVIIRECVGWVSMLAFVALIFATPRVDKKYRLLGFLIGLPIIWIVNLIRLFTTFYIVYLYGLNYFELVHTFLWRVSLILFIFGLWLAWFKISKREMEYKWL